MSLKVKMEGDLLTAEALSAWKRDPVSQMFLRVLVAWRDELMQQWARGRFSGDTPQATAEANANALGQVDLLQRMLAIDADQINAALGLDDDDQELEAANRMRSQAAKGEI